jgi:hypothetical protein
MEALPSPLSSRPERTRISCHAALDKAPCAPFRKEGRRKYTNATKVNRKSGVAQWRDLLCAPRAARIPEVSQTLLQLKIQIGLNRSRLFHPANAFNGLLEVPRHPLSVMQPRIVLSHCFHCVSAYRSPQTFI